jgi:hypothetical protein
VTSFEQWLKNDVWHLPFPPTDRGALEQGSTGRDMAQLNGIVPEEAESLKLHLFASVKTIDKMSGAGIAMGVRGLSTVGYRRALTDSVDGRTTTPDGPKPRQRIRR